MPGDTEILLATSDARAAAEIALVLESRGCLVDIEHYRQRVILRVPAGQIERSRAELAAWVNENPPVEEPAAAPAPSGSGWPGVLVYWAIIVAAVPLVAGDWFGRDWVSAGRIDSTAMAAGEWWRAVTALTLHADAAHLLGNAGFGAFFGYSLARSVGGGFAWLLILGCGIAGNAANALLAGPGHRAIGASTAVFAALGLLTGFSWRSGFRAWKSWRQRVAPLIAGIGLLAFTGAGGENTDIGAHLTGFLAGLAVGAALVRTGRPESPRAQLACGAAAVAIVVAAWVAALA